MKIFNVIFPLLYCCVGFSNSDIDLYQPGTSLFNVQEDIKFWDKKLQKSNEETHQLQLADTWLRHFKLTSEITSLNQAVSMIEQVYYGYTLNRGPVCRKLARLYITQHRFCDALDMALESAETGDNERATQLLLYDVYAELGMGDAAREIKGLLSYTPDFQYFIRAAKWEDSKGNLSAAIQLLERARTMAESSKDTDKLKWIYSNLGDFYGHDGQIEKSREHYIKALKVDPADWYSFKGLVWIYYSAFKNEKTALDMIKILSKYNHSPDLALLEAEIHAYQGKEYYSRVMEQQTMLSISNDQYGVLYRMVLAEYWSDNENHNRAIVLAEAEIDSRDTPETRALLAYCYHQAGLEDRARMIVQSYVYGKTSEPMALYHILETVNYNPEIQLNVINELKQADYELGPQLSKKIHSISKGIKPVLIDVY